MDNEKLIKVLRVSFRMACAKIEQLTGESAEQERNEILLVAIKLIDACETANSGVNQQ